MEFSQGLKAAGVPSATTDLPLTSQDGIPFARKYGVPNPRSLTVRRRTGLVLQRRRAAASFRLAVDERPAAALARHRDGIPDLARRQAQAVGAGAPPIDDGTTKVGSVAVDMKPFAQAKYTYWVHLPKESPAFKAFRRWWALPPSLPSNFISLCFRQTVHGIEAGSPIASAAKPALSAAIPERLETVVDTTADCPEAVC